MLIFLIFLEILVLAFLHRFWIGESMPASHQNSQTSKKIEIDISIFFGYSLLCWRIVKHSCDFIAVSVFIFLIECFLRLWSWIMPFTPKKLWYIMSGWLGRLRMDFLYIQKFPHVVFPPAHPYNYKTLTLKTNS